MIAAGPCALAWAGKGPLRQNPKTAAQSTDFWSLKPIRKPAVPSSPFESFSRNPIDRFIFAKLAQKGLKPAPPASKRDLLKRVSIDLTGLPPTPDELGAFVSDRSPDAYAKVVDRLLNSTAYGERWGRHWLDVVRFGESHGYEQNHLRPNAWPYRDYVIRAFNQDIPYTQFIAEQLAGDRLAGNDNLTQAATGFLVAGIHDTVGIQEEEGTRQQRSNDLDDMVSTTGAAFLGLTVGCAKCHDHKFDPTAQRDYYRMSACFAGVRHGERSILPDAELKRQEPELKEIRRNIQQTADKINEIDGKGRETILRQKGLTVTTRPPVTARRNVDSFPAQRARFVRFTILETRDNAEPCIDELQIIDTSGTNVALANGSKATASSLLPGYVEHQIAHLIDGKFGNSFSWISSERGTGWAQVELPKEATIKEVVWSRDGADIPRFDDRLATRYKIEISQDGKQWNTVSTEQGRQGSNDYIHPDEIAKALTPEQRSDRQKLVVERDRLNRRMAAINSANSVYCGTFTKPDPTYLLRRGDVMQRADEVTPGGLSCVSAISNNFTVTNESDRRLELAKWIGSTDNPLTARVFVNRVWQHHFGRGIVSTPSDFGRNGERPTHPELLDWLASDYMEHGWTLKRLHKLIVTSYTYCQSSAVSSEAAAKDAGNQFLSHANIQRMEAEPMRDAILQTSGKLDRTIGGPGYQLFTYRVVNIAIYGTREDYGPETWRRSVYQQAARSIHDEVLSAFDCPESSQRAPRRDSTTTALQALNLLNGPFMQQQSAFMAERIQKDCGNSVEKQITEALQLATLRSPNKNELKTAMDFVKKQGLVNYCRVLLNSNEFLYY